MLNMFNILLYILIFFFGGVIGSFLNVLIDRIPRGEVVTKGRSHCESCHHLLAWYDLFPFFSFIFLQGKCRYCHKPIGFQTIVLETLTGVVFVVVTYTLIQQNTLPPLLAVSLFYSLSIVSSFMVIAFIDAKHGIIPNSIVYSATLISIVYHLFFWQTALPYFLSACGAGLFFLLLFIATKGRGMGFGDVKLAFLLGLFLGFPAIIIALYLSFLTGAIIAFILVIRKKKKFSGGTIAFGPFLILGSVIAFLFGNFLLTQSFFSFLRLL